MKIIGILLWIFLAGAVSAETGEKLALTVHNENGFPGEPQSFWTQEYYTDAMNRLVRIHEVIAGEFLGDPPKVTDTRLTWDNSTLTWDGPTGPGVALWKDGRIVLERGVLVDLFRFEVTEDLVSWVDGELSGSWSRLDGYQDGDPGKSGYTTRGSRLSRWVNGNENDRILLDRSPRRLRGLYVAPSESGVGWFETGFIEVSGTGLWIDDPTMRWQLASFFCSTRFFQLWPAFVFERNYLK